MGRAAGGGVLRAAGTELPRAAAAGAATADETGGGAALPTVLAASPKSNLLQSPIYTGASPRAHKALLRLGSALKPPKYFAARPGRGAR